MNIRVLDGYTLNPGDLNWEKLREFGDVTVYDRTAPDMVISRSQGAEALIVNKVALDSETMSALPELEYIGIAATGYDLIDLDAAASRGIAVSNVPGYSGPSVAQGAFALLLELTNRVGLHAQGVRDGKWAAREDFSYLEHPVTELFGKKMGIFGYGDTGRRTAGIAHSLGMHVLVCTRTIPDRDEPGIRFCSREELIRESDVISLHCPLTERTGKMVDEKWLSNMKKTAFLINTARGQLVDENALDRALREGRIAGAGLDVLDGEPPQAENPLFSAPNCFITPHICWASRESRQRLMHEIGENLSAFVRGSKRNRVV